MQRWFPRWHRWWADVGRLARLPGAGRARPPDLVRPLVEQLGRRMALELSETSPHRFELKGTLGGHAARIRVDAHPGPDGRPRFEQQFELTTEAALVELPVHIGPPGRWPHAPTIGEPIFDRLARAHGPSPAGCHAVLGPRLRAAVVRLGGVWTIEPHRLSWRAERAPTYLNAASELMLDVLEELGAVEGDTSRALAERALRDPLASVRRRALRLLAERGPEALAARTALDALWDGNPHVMAEALRCVPESFDEEAGARMLAIALDPETPPAVRDLAARRAGQPERFREAAWAQLVDEAHLPIAALAVLALVGTPEDASRLAQLRASLHARRHLERAIERIRDRCGLVGGTLALLEDGGELALSSEGELSPPAED